MDKKKPAAPTKVQAGFFEEPNTYDSTCKPGKFAGSDNPRHMRALAAMLRRPMPRESLDREAGCANGPDLIAELRRRGLAIPCERIHFIDRDGKDCRPGVYSLTSSDRNKIYRWMATGRQAKGGAA